DGSYRSLLLTLPSEATIAQEMSVVDPAAIHEARINLRRRVVAAHADWFRATYAALTESGAYRNDQRSIDARRLKNTTLAYLTIDGDGESLELAARQFATSDNMTDKVAALRALTNHPGPQCEAALQDFYGEYHTMPLVLDKWFAAQASADAESTLERVIALTRHADFTVSTPNRVRALIGNYAINHARFHQSDGGGYRLLSDFVIKIDQDNPQLASRLVSRLNDYRRFEAVRQSLMRSELERIAAVTSLSKDVREIVERALEF
ncbi:MAG: aminopeptidase N C-terminal domain-containing protein, partial [Planctomycetales bacterium]|nr:aminopeptidase N C-terminal domain-containing protein [Planctomycetales bacterium]